MLNLIRKDRINIRSDPFVFNGSGFACLEYGSNIYHYLGNKDCSHSLIQRSSIHIDRGSDRQHKPTPFIHSFIHSFIYLVIHSSFGYSLSLIYSIDVRYLRENTMIKNFDFYYPMLLLRSLCTCKSLDPRGSSPRGGRW